MKEDVKWFPHKRCARPHGLWSAPDKDATEHEVTAFVAALVGLLKPLLVVETGTYRAHTTRAICAALQANNDTGVLLTFETDAVRAAAALVMLGEHADAGRVTVHAHAITPADLPGPVDLAFLDSGMRTREDDMRVIWPALAPGGIVLVHDASPDRPPGQVRPPSRYAMLDIATPRGLTIFQKPWRTVQ